MNIEIIQPTDYQYGAWQVTVTLTDEEQLYFKKVPLPFPLPSLQNRLIVWEKDYVMAVAEEKETVLKAKFVDGVWHGHVYSSGIAEKENPTSIDVVKQEIEKAVAETIIAIKEICKE
jgi:hypothetical protein